MASMNNGINKLFFKGTDLQSKLSFTCECLKEQIKKRNTSKTSQNTLRKQLTESKKERGSFKSKLSACVEKLIHLWARNVNKRINTQKNYKALLK